MIPQVLHHDGLAASWQYSLGASWSMAVFLQSVPIPVWASECIPPGSVQCGESNRFLLLLLFNYCNALMKLPEHF